MPHCEEYLYHSARQGLIDVTPRARRKPCLGKPNTTPLACSRNMDLVDDDLHPAQRDALRCLRYDNGPQGCNTVQDSLVGRAVWHCGRWCSRQRSPSPRMLLSSHNIHDDPNKPAVLIACYTVG